VAEKEKVLIGEAIASETRDFGAFRLYPRFKIEDHTPI
jgi:hypothetical protein